MKVLVTGGTGAIGSWVPRELVDAGFQPVVYDAMPDTLLLKDILEKIEIVKGDIADFPQLIGILKKMSIDAIIHCASLIGANTTVNPLYTLKVNVEGTVNIFEAARILDIKRVVFASALAAVGPVEPEYGYPQFKPLEEDHPCNPQELYGITKEAAERYGLFYAKSYGLDLIALRFTQLYGPGRMARHGSFNLIDIMIDAAYNDKSYELPSGADFETEWTYTRDDARALVSALIAQGVKHRVFNIGSGEFSSVQKIIDTVKTKFPMAKIRVGSGRNIPLPLPSLRFNTTRASEELHFSPKYDLKKGIDEYVEILASIYPK
ncbi:MAG: NAD(P)-dependent oxidoreductase [Nitrososphaerota archaeon]|nr:NAD(P)-dependent oxidoreductase [Nitrososphaerota archaeon]